MNEKFIAIDEDGFFLIMGQRLENEDYCHALFLNLQRDEKGRFFSSVKDQKLWIEAFDEPLIARQITKNPDGTWTIHFHYGYSTPLILERLSLDEWDRFHGVTPNGVPFVLSRSAQADFFQKLDSFDDDSIVVDSNSIPIPPWLLDDRAVDRGEFWNQRYQNKDTPWDLDRPAQALEQAISQLKIPKQRILVLGCGTGTDAAYLAKLGHITTGVDISVDAIRQAKEKFGHVKNLNFLNADIFNLPQTLHKSFDLVFEHTCYCAISPSRRNELVEIWRRVLVSDGHILGIFFTMDRREAPPFGGSEWEIRQRLHKSFDFLYWTRWKKSIESRQGAELVIFARRKDNLI